MRRLSTAAVLVSLLAVYLGVPCLALAQVHSRMASDHDAMAGEAASPPCETGDASSAVLLCAAPSTYAPLAATLPDLLTGTLAHASFPAPLVIASVPAPAPRNVDLSGADPPAFLLHRALLI